MTSHDLRASGAPWASSVLLIDNRADYFLRNRSPLASALVANNIRVEATALSGSSADFALMADLAQVHQVEESASLVQQVRHMRFVVKNSQAEFIHIFTLRAIVLFLAFAPRTSHTVVGSITGLGYAFTSTTASAKVTKLVVSAIVQVLGHRVDHWIFQNQDDQNVFKGLGVDNVDQSLIRGSGVDLNHFRFEPEHVREGEPPIVLFVGRLLLDKGIREFLTAAESIGDRARFVVVGDVDPQNPASLSQHEVQQWADRGVIEWVGHRDDVSTYLRSASIVCLPSYREGLPKALLEAAAIGRAMVAADAPGSREVVLDGETGLLAKVRDGRDLASKLDVLLHDHGLRSRMGEAARQHVESELSSAVVTSSTIRLYQSLQETS